MVVRLRVQKGCQNKPGYKPRSINDSRERRCPATIKKSVAQTKAGRTEGAEGPNGDNGRGTILGKPRLSGAIVSCGAEGIANVAEVGIG